MAKTAARSQNPAGGAATQPPTRRRAHLPKAIAIVVILASAVFHVPVCGAAEPPAAVQQSIETLFDVVRTVGNGVSTFADDVARITEDGLEAQQRVVKDFTGCPSNAAQGMYDDLRAHRLTLAQVIHQAGDGETQARAARNACTGTMSDEWDYLCIAAYNQLPFRAVREAAQEAQTAVQAGILSLEQLRCVSGCDRRPAVSVPEISIAMGTSRGTTVNVCTEWDPGDFTLDADANSSELSAEVRARLPSCKTVTHLTAAACQWDVSMLVTVLQDAGRLPRHVRAQAVTLQIPNKSVRAVTGITRARCAGGFRLCTQATVSGTVIIDPVALANDPVEAIQRTLASLPTTACTREEIVGCTSPPFGLRAVYGNVEVPDPENAQLIYIEKDGTPTGIVVDLRDLVRVACTPQPVSIPGPPRLSVGQRNIPLLYLCLQPRWRPVLASY